MAGSVILALVRPDGAVRRRAVPRRSLGHGGPPVLWPGQDAEFPLGTDSLGRDVLAGLVHGARVSLLVGVAAAAIGLAIGTVVGALAGFFGGWVDTLLMRVVELFQTTPTFLLVVVIVAIGDPTVQTIAVAIGVASWPTVARLVRAQFRSLREADFVMAARSLGYWQYPHHRAGDPAQRVAADHRRGLGDDRQRDPDRSRLSFLNMRDPNLISWGGMIGEGRDLLRTAWFLTALPGVAIARPCCRSTSWATG